jgi:hypothetical protein
MNSELKQILLEFVVGDDFKTTYENAVEGDYTDFVNQLKGWAGDPKVREFLKSGQQDGLSSEEKFTVSGGSIKCSQLIPTQNEIDLNKSLDYPLKDANCCKTYLEGNNISIGGAPIITFNGRYIIDGHHRWSQVYCINPNATMKVLNFKKSGVGPTEMLKATQVAIAATTGTVAVQNVEGHNLLTLSPQIIMKYVINNISDASAKVLAKTKEIAGKKIALNAQSMQQHNKPIAGAPARGVMPQTEGDLPGVIKALTSGIAQTIKPFSKEVNTESKIMKNKKRLNEWDPSMSNDPSAPFNQDDWGGLKRQLAILALKDSSLEVTPESLPTVQDSDIESWLEVADPEDKIWKKFEGTIKSDKFMDKTMKEDDHEGYEKAIAPLVFPFYKLYVNKMKKQAAGLSDAESKQNNQIKRNFRTESITLKEFQSFAAENKDKLYSEIVDKLRAGGLTEINDKEVYDFIDYNYDLIDGVIDTIDPTDLVKNYVDFLNKPEAPAVDVNRNDLNESLNKLLKEDDSVDAADPVLMFQDFSDMSGSLADIYSTLVGYQTSYIQNPKVQAAIGQMMQGVNQLMKQSTATMQVIGAGFGLQEKAQLKKKRNH